MEQEKYQMAKRIESFFLFVMLVLCTSFIISCGSFQQEPPLPTTFTAQSDPSLSQANITSPTGYADSGIQFSSIFYDGTLYYVDSVVGSFTKDDLDRKILELGAVYVGLIRTETNHRWPSADLEASRLPVSLPVYYDKTDQTLYVVFDEELRSLSPYQEELYDLNAKK